MFLYLASLCYVGEDLVVGWRMKMVLASSASDLKHDWIDVFDCMVLEGIGFVKFRKRLLSYPLGVSELKFGQFDLPLGLLPCLFRQRFLRLRNPQLLLMNPFFLWWCSRSGIRELKLQVGVDFVVGFGSDNGVWGGFYYRNGGIWNYYSTALWPRGTSAEIGFAWSCSRQACSCLHCLCLWLCFWPQPPYVARVLVLNKALHPTKLRIHSSQILNYLYVDDRAFKNRWSIAQKEMENWIN